MSEEKTIGKLARESTFRYFGTFFMEQKKNKWVMSLGRTSFIILFALAFYMWATFLGVGSVTLPPDMLKLLMVLASYNFGSKVAEIVKSYIKEKKENKVSIEVKEQKN